MKNLKQILLVLLVLTSATLQARSVQRFVRVEADFVKPSLWEYENYSEVREGSVNVFYDSFRRKGNITLNLTFEWSCPPNALCSLEVPKQEITLPIVDLEVDECGVVTYFAEEDHMPVDGAYNSIEVIDASRNKCPILMVYPKLPDTQVIHKAKWYDRLQGKLEVTSGEFYAETLQ